MYKIIFEYYSIEEGMTIHDSFEITDNNFQNFLNWIEDNDINIYKITNIEVYTD